MIRTVERYLIYVVVPLLVIILLVAQCFRHFHTW